MNVIYFLWLLGLMIMLMIIVWPIRPMVLVTSLPSLFSIYLCLSFTYYIQGIVSVSFAEMYHFWNNFVPSSRSAIILFYIDVWKTVFHWSYSKFDNFSTRWLLHYLVRSLNCNFLLPFYSSLTVQHPWGRDWYVGRKLGRKVVWSSSLSVCPNPLQKPNIKSK